MVQRRCDAAAHNCEIKMSSRFSTNQRRFALHQQHQRQISGNELSQMTIALHTENFVTSQKTKLHSTPSRKSRRNTIFSFILEYTFFVLLAPLINFNHNYCNKCLQYWLQLCVSIILQADVQSNFCIYHCDDISKLVRWLLVSDDWVLTISDDHLAMSIF